MSEGTGKPGAYIRSILIYVPGFFCAFALLVSIRVLKVVLFLFTKLLYLNQEEGYEKFTKVHCVFVDSSDGGRNACNTGK